MNKTLLILMF